VILAITGGTGFVGSRLLEAATAAGHQLRALTRKARRPRVGVTWVRGALEEPEALEQLVEGADALIHVAGVITGRTAADFDSCNVGGTEALLDAARRAGIPRFVHVSSLAAREPGLSLYGASKAKSEELVRASGLPFAIVRPPAVYGPGDRETLDLFKMAKRRLVFMPPNGRLSLIHADDLSRLLLALAEPGAPGGLLIEPDDGHAGGWSHREFARALGEAVGTRPLVIHVPSVVLKAAAAADQAARGSKAKLTADRAAYFAHRDWVADPAQAAPAALWQPGIPARDGLKSAVLWYQQQGWL
jgi:nucleoside-diphosphate-sugar epimerase